MQKKKSLKSTNHDVTQDTAALPSNLDSTSSSSRSLSEVHAKSKMAIRTENLVKKLNKDLRGLKKTLRKERDGERRQLKLKFKEKRLSRSSDAVS